MSQWVIKNPLVFAQDITETRDSAEPACRLGTIVVAEHPTYGAGEFIYLQGVASTVVGDWVTYNADDFGTTRIVPNAIGPVAIAMSANVANQFGWYQIQGKAVGRADAGFLDNANVYISASAAGSVDDAIVAGDRVKLAKGASAVGTPSAGLAEFEISRPFVDDGLAA